LTATSQTTSGTICLLDMDCSNDTLQEGEDCSNSHIVQEETHCDDTSQNSANTTIILSPLLENGQTISNRSNSSENKQAASIAQLSINQNIRLPDSNITQSDSAPINRSTTKSSKTSLRASTVSNPYKKHVITPATEYDVQNLSIHADTPVPNNTAKYTQQYVPTQLMHYNQQKRSSVTNTVVITPSINKDQKENESSNNRASQMKSQPIQYITKANITDLLPSVRLHGNENENEEDDDEARVRSNDNQTDQSTNHDNSDVYGHHAQNNSIWTSSTFVNNFENDDNDAFVEREEEEEEEANKCNNFHNNASTNKNEKGNEMMIDVNSDNRQHGKNTPRTKSADSSIASRHDYNINKSSANVMVFSSLLQTDMDAFDDYEEEE
jgi:hypothetical protein